MDDKENVRGVDEVLEVDMVDDTVSNVSHDEDISDGDALSAPTDDPMDMSMRDAVLPDVQMSEKRDYKSEYQNEEEDDPEDIYKPEGTIYLDIDRFSEFAKGPADVQQRLSKAVMVRGLPWKILAIPRDNSRTGNDRRPAKALGFFLQCNGDSEQAAWSCIASATLKVLAQVEGFDEHSRRISHTFYPKENDWGYSQFMACDQLMSRENGFLKDDCIKLVVTVSADAPHGVHWDSKKHTGYIGLKNQGATCYMNSILQTLFFTNQLRKAVYEMPTCDDEAESSVALAMQRVFYDLQHSEKPVGTKKLTKSFGWDSLDSFLQHDVQELCRVLLDNLENKMKGTMVADTIPQLFKGQMKSFIRCTEVSFESAREESFYDVQLNIKGKNDIVASFRDYTEAERLDGDNKYDAGEYGLQPALKGVKFVSFPPILHLQLMRFQYDPQLETNVKINDRFEFPDKLNLNEFVEDRPDAEDYTYVLQAVLVHTGDFHGGHYVVFINTNLKSNTSKWCKFDDDVVSRATFRDAVTANYGGDDADSPNRVTSAYMLVYVRQSCISDVLSPLSDRDIPKHLRDRFENERDEELKKKKEKQEAHLYTEVVLVTSADMSSHHGFDLFDYSILERDGVRERIEKRMSIDQLYEFAADRLYNTEQRKVSLDAFRVWCMVEDPLRDENHILSLPRLRPSKLIVRQGEGSKKTVEEVLDNDRNILYVEGPIDVGGIEQLPEFDDKNQMMVFLKYYNDKKRQLIFCGHVMVHFKRSVEQVMEEACARASLEPGTRLRFYEEVAPDRITPLKANTLPLCQPGCLAEVQDGCILIFEREEFTDKDNNAKAILDAEYNRLDVEVVSNSEHYNFPSTMTSADEPVQGTIGLNWSMSELVQWIGKNIDFDPARILLWKVSPFNEKPTQQLSDTNFRQFTVRELLQLCNSQAHDPRRQRRYRVIYSRMPVLVADLEKRKQMRVQLMDDKMNIVETTVFPEKNGTVASILEEARREFKFSEGGTKQLRLVYVGLSTHALRVFQIFPPELSVADVYQKIMTPTMYTARIEEVPVEQEQMKQNQDYLLPVAHFDKEPGRMFGTPFYFKVSDGETLKSVRERIREKLDVNEREFEKYKFALIANGRLVRYLDMDSNNKVNLAELQHTHHTAPASAPYLGIDHMNKCRGSRGGHAAEKAIVIHN